MSIDTVPPWAAVALLGASAGWAAKYPSLLSISGALLSAVIYGVVIYRSKKSHARR